MPPDVVCRLLLAGLAAALLATPGAAQRFWTTSYAPYAYYSGIDGFWFGAVARATSPTGFDQPTVPFRASLRLRGAASTEGSHVARLDADAPAWWDGWRARLSLTLRRENRLGYYGLGNGTDFDADSVTVARPYFYGVARSTRGARLTIQRRLVGPLRALAGAGLERTDFRELPGESLFRRDHAAGVVDSSRVPFADATVRGGLVLDTRDHEIDPRRGVLLEAVYARGRGYERTSGVARAWISPFARLCIAARLGAERMSGDPPLAAQVQMEASEQPIVAVGGNRSLRGYHDARFVGPGKLLGSAEVRYTLLGVRTLFELKAGAFYDVGRVFAPGEDVGLTTTGLHTSWGGELAARLGLNTLLVLGAGFGTDGWEVIMDTAWAF